MIQNNLAMITSNTIMLIHYSFKSDSFIKCIPRYFIHHKKLIITSIYFGTLASMCIA